MVQLVLRLLLLALVFCAARLALVRGGVAVFATAALCRCALCAAFLILGTFAQFLGQRQLLDLLLKELLYLFEEMDIFLVDEGYGHTVAVGTGCTAYAVNIVFSIVRHVKVDDHGNVVDIDSSCEDVGSHEHVDLSALKLVEHLVALGLVEVRVHLAAVDVHAHECAVYGLHLLLLAREDDDALEVALLEDVLNDAELLCLVAHIGCLLDLLCRLAHGELHHHGVLEQRLCQLFNLVGHGGREHDGLAGWRQQLCDFLYVFREAHVEHAVSLVEHEERHTAKVGIAHTYVADQSARCGYDHVGTQAKALELLVVAVAVVAAIDGHAAHVVKIIAEALHGLVYLLCQLACGAHDDAVDGVFGVAAVVELAQYGQQVSSRFACSCLCHAQEVVAFQYLWYALLLNGRAGLEAHVVESVENVVV